MKPVTARTVHAGQQLMSFWVERPAIKLVNQCYHHCKLMSSGSSNTNTRRDETRARIQEDLMKKRQEFIEAEKERQSKVDFSRLSPKEAELHQLHKEAVEALKFTYEDPYLGLKVVTTYRHTLKGTCCGQACRHCVYQHEAVFESRRVERTFNSSFWRDIDDPNFVINENSTGSES